MPNWCSNTLTLTGPECAVHLVIGRLAEPVREDGVPSATVDLNRIVPYPEAFAAQDEVACDWMDRLYARLVECGVGHFDKTGQWVSPSSSPELGALRAEVTAAFTAEAGPCPASGFSLGGGKWSLAHWGTKWNVCDASPWAITRLKRSGWIRAVVRFDSAWSPPVTAFNALAAELPPKVRMRLAGDEPANEVRVRRRWGYGLFPDPVR